MPTVFSVGQYLTAAQMTSLAAQAAAGGEYVPPVQTVTVAATPITFLAVPSTLRSLTLEWTARSNGGGFLAQAIVMQINGSSLPQYFTQLLQGSNATPTAAPQVGGTSASVGLVPHAAATAGVFGRGEIRVFGWHSPHSTNLGFGFESIFADATVSTEWNIAGGGVFRLAGPYTSISLAPASGAFDVGSCFRLVGKY